MTKSDLLGGLLQHKEMDSETEILDFSVLRFVGI